MSAPVPIGASVDAADVARFSAIAEDWWNPRGKFAPLHALNPLRLGFIRDRALARFQRNDRERAPFVGLRALDIGCGGGLICEPLARLGFAVTGLDASERNISFAKNHAASTGLDIDYRAGTAEELLALGVAPFDLVVSMEVVEHVADPGLFLRDCAQLTAAGGLMVIATLNRTLRSLSLGKIAAEHILRWVPVGTHDWRKFVRPDEIARYLANSGLRLEYPRGAKLDAFTGRWSLSEDVSINYFLAMTRDEPQADARGVA
jgi:2-polyprenyl-6-hydroxyphenyl methylase/3-demethylubiquinone-9 3-methyltransferase